MTKMTILAVMFAMTAAACVEEPRTVDTVEHCTTEDQEAGACGGGGGGGDTAALQAAAYGDASSWAAQAAAQRDAPPPSGGVCTYGQSGATLYASCNFNIGIATVQCITGATMVNGAIHVTSECMVA